MAMQTHRTDCVTRSVTTRLPYACCCVPTKYHQHEDEVEAAESKQQDKKMPTECHQHRDEGGVVC